MSKADINTYPQFVIKAFSQESHAMDFINSGSFIVRELRQYKNTEDTCRRDRTEGDAHFQYKEQVTSIHIYPDSDISTSSEQPGLMQVHASMGNPVLVFCTSLPDVDQEYIKQKFGEYLVKISNPGQLALDIQLGVKNAGYKPIGNVRAEAVEYTKGKIVAEDLPIPEGNRLSYIQKPEEFSNEKEFRFASVLGGLIRPSQLPECVEINLGQSIKYATRIS